MTVEGTNLVDAAISKTRACASSRGDKVTIAADGTITMTPWGNQALSTPDGAPNYGWFVQNKIAGGTLVGKIGPQGSVFRIGSKHTFTADRTGVLVVVAMQGDLQNQQPPASIA